MAAEASSGFLTGLTSNAPEKIWAGYDKATQVVSWGGRQVCWIASGVKAAAIWCFHQLGKETCSKCELEFRGICENFHSNVIDNVPTVVWTGTRAVRDLTCRIFSVFEMTPQEKNAAIIRRLDELAEQWKELIQLQAKLSQALVEQGKGPDAEKIQPLTKEVGTDPLDVALQASAQWKKKMADKADWAHEDTVRCAERAAVTSAVAWALFLIL